MLPAKLFESCQAAVRRSLQQTPILEQVDLCLAYDMPAAYGQEMTIAHAIVLQPMHSLQKLHSSGCTIDADGAPDLGQSWRHTIPRYISSQAM